MKQLLATLNYRSGHVLNYQGSALDSRQCLELINWILKEAFEVDQWAILNLVKTKDEI